MNGGISFNDQNEPQVFNKNDRIKTKHHEGEYLCLLADRDHALFVKVKGINPMILIYTDNFISSNKEGYTVIDYQIII